MLPLFASELNIRPWEIELLTYYEFAICEAWLASRSDN